MKMSTLQALINLYEEEEQKCLSAGSKNIYTRFVIVNSHLLRHFHFKLCVYYNNYNEHWPIMGTIGYLTTTFLVRVI